VRSVCTARGRAVTCPCSLVVDLEIGTGLTAVRTQKQLAEAGDLPSWLGDPDVHRSHQSALLRKDPDHYRDLFPGVPDDLPYVWPVPAG